MKATHDMGTFPCHYVPADQNPSDLGTRGIAPRKLGEIWLESPAWFTDRSLWPVQPEITESKEASCETLPAKKEKVLLEKEGGATNERKEWVETIIRKHK
jgi:hypothetical protein